MFLVKYDLQRDRTVLNNLAYKVVAVGGLEPPRPKATDFESVVYTNFTTPPLFSLNACYLSKFNLVSCFALGTR